MVKQEKEETEIKEKNQILLCKSEQVRDDLGFPELSPGPCGS